MLSVLLCGCLEDLSALSNGSPKEQLSPAGNGGITVETAGFSNNGGAGDAGSSDNAAASNRGVVFPSAGAANGGSANVGSANGGSEVSSGGNPNSSNEAGAAGAPKLGTCMFYQDGDGDGYGDASRPSTNCSPPAGFVSDNNDCNDANPSIHPGANEACDTVDNDCDPKTNDLCPIGCAAIIGPASHIYMACSLTKNITWTTAESGCETQAMKLVRIDDAAENQFVNKIQRALASTPHFMWIGGTDLPFTGTWRFPDGTTFWQNSSSPDGLYTNWNQGEPTEGKEHCLGMWIDVATWNDFDCVAATGPGYLCELY